MRFAYADPPYLGCGKLYPEHARSLDWDVLKTHENLIDRLDDEFPDGWAMSLSSPTLKHLLPLCPEDARVMAWVKPFAIFKPNVTVAYAWEPVIVRGGRKRPKSSDTVRDWISAEITLKKGLTGAKPDRFSFWLFEVLGMERADEFVDLFPGTGGVTRAWNQWQRQGRLFV